MQERGRHFLFIVGNVHEIEQRLEEGQPVVGLEALCAAGVCALEQAHEAVARKRFGFLLQLLLNGRMEVAVRTEEVHPRLHVVGGERLCVVAIHEVGKRAGGMDEVSRYTLEGAPEGPFPLTGRNLGMVDQRVAVGLAGALYFGVAVVHPRGHQGARVTEFVRGAMLEQLLQEVRNGRRHGIGGEGVGIVRAVGREGRDETVEQFINNRASHDAWALLRESKKINRFVNVQPSRSFCHCRLSA